MEEKDLKQIREAVKEEVKGFATKADLKNLATKDDVKNAVEKGINKSLAEFWQGNLEPAFNEVHESLGIMQTKLEA